MRGMITAGLVLLAAGCGEKDGDSGEDTAAAASAQGTAPLAELSSGECPDMSASGNTSTFLSSAEERTATVIYPSAPEGEMAVVFFFHGLMDPGSTPQPTEYMATALQVQAMADELNAVVVLPESPIWNYAGFEFFLWMVEDNTFDNDIALYDDLRTCVAQEFTVDLDQVYAMGFSGGALFTTIVASQRGDTLAGVVEMSGGADLEVALAQDIVAPYDTPAYTMPALLASGGEQDVWPDPSLALVNFDEGTDTLAGNLVADGHFTVQCRHSYGHTVTNPELEAAKDWVRVHRYNEASPYLTDGLPDSMASWCEVVSAAE